MSRVSQKKIVATGFLLTLAACSGANTEPTRSDRPSSRAALPASVGDMHGSRLPDNRAGAGMAVAAGNRTTEHDLQQRLAALEQSLVEQRAALERLRATRAEPEPLPRPYVNRPVAGFNDRRFAEGAGARNAVNLIEQNERALQSALQPRPERLRAVYEAYRAGQMPPEDAQAFENDIRSGKINLARGATFLDGSPAISRTAAQASGAPRTLPQEVLDAYTQRRMTVQERQLFERHAADGVIQLPEGFPLSQTLPQEVLGTQSAPPSATDGPTVAAAQAARLQSELDALELERRAAASRAGGPSTEQVQSLERRAIELEAALRRFGRI